MLRSTHEYLSKFDRPMFVTKEILRLEVRFYHNLEAIEGLPGVGVYHELSDIFSDFWDIAHYLMNSLSLDWTIIYLEKRLRHFQVVLVL